MVTNLRPIVHVNEKIMQFFFFFGLIICHCKRGHFRDATQSLKNQNSVILVYLLRVFVLYKHFAISITLNPTLILTLTPYLYTAPALQYRLCQCLHWTLNPTTSKFFKKKRIKISGNHPGVKRFYNCRNTQSYISGYGSYRRGFSPG